MFEHEFFDYLAGYALGALPPLEKARLEEHLRIGCELCEPELLVLNETVGRLPYGVSVIEMRPGLKERTRTHLENEGVFHSSEKKIVHSKSERSYWFAAAAIFAAALATALYWSSYTQLKEQSNTVAQKEAQIAEMEKALLQKDAQISWLRDPGVQLALLTGLTQASQAKGKMIWHPIEHKGIFYVESLPPLVPDKSYQLWVIGAQGPVSAGIFAPDTRGAAVLTISRIEGRLDGAPQFAVTIEPYGGVSKPTTTPILLGKPL